MVKRVVSLCGVVLCALSATVAPVAVGAPAESGPKCANITNGSFGYTETSAGSGIVAGTAQLESAACKSVTYTLYVYDELGGTLLGSNSSPTPSALGVQYSFSVSGNNDNDVCVYMTTTSNGGKIHDRAPDENVAQCVEVSAPGGVGGFN